MRKELGRKEWGVNFYPGNLKEADNMEDIDVDGRIILKLILKGKYL
jgi:hypothetical protein